MDKGVLETAFNIRYVKLHFFIEFIENAITPKYKTSALRGGMGEMLLNANCVRDRKCEYCDFEKECIVRRTMYPKMAIKPTFMTVGDSVGYVIECEDYRESFPAGEILQFNLILFGKTIVLFNQFLNAFSTMGMNGLGSEHSRFFIKSVTNTKNKLLFEDQEILMENFEILHVSDYVDFRKNQISKAPDGKIRFKTPLSIKSQGEEMREFIPAVITESACRRIFILDCFEGVESRIHDMEYIHTLNIPNVLYEEHKSISVRRFSNHKDSAMYLKGIEGRIEVDSLSGDLLDILLAGELVHIGKNTSFGFGRYRIS